MCQCPMQPISNAWQSPRWLSLTIQHQYLYRSPVIPWYWDSLIIFPLPCLKNFDRLQEFLESLKERTVMPTVFRVEDISVFLPTTRLCIWKKYPICAFALFWLLWVSVLQIEDIVRAAQRVCYRSTQQRAAAWVWLWRFWNLQCQQLSHWIAGSLAGSFLFCSLSVVMLYRWKV